jgi:diguanylate cyclase (GGDEF)-like protein
VTGDAVLKEVGRRINQAVRSYDFLGRYGGEEFLAVLSECSPTDVRTVAERIRSAVADTPIQTAATSLSVTISAGGVVTSNLAPGVDLLSAADAVLYEAKAKGRNRVEIGTL